MSKTKALWTSSILQTLLELSHLEAATVFINMDQLDLSQHKSLELIIYTYCITGMYSQAFMLLLLKENDINSLRYKNVFSLFVNIMLNHKQFETLCSFSLSEKQEELIKEILCDSRLLCYYLPFTDSRKCLLDGLSKAKELFKKLHQEKEKAHGYSARDAQINYKLLGNLIKMYMHNLKFYDKFEECDKNAFDDDFNMDIDNEMALEDYPESIERFDSETPKSEEILTMLVPKRFRDPFIGSVRKDQPDPNKSVIKLIESVEKSSEFNNKIDFKSKLQGQKPSQNILLSQRRDHLFNELEDDICVVEDEEDIREGKNTAYKFIKNLKSKETKRFEERKEKTKNKPSEAVFERKTGYGEMDLFSVPKAQTESKRDSAASKPDNSNANSERNRITKETLLAGLPDRVKNLKGLRDSLKEGTKDDLREEVKERPKKKEQSPLQLFEQEPLIIKNYSPKISQDVQMEIQEEAEDQIKKSEQQELIEEPDKSFEGFEEQVNDVQASFAPINFEPSARKRKMSFDICGQPQLELMFDQNNQEINILGDSATFGHKGFVPNFSNANDDIDVGRKRDKDSIMGFLYAGDVPNKHSSKNKKRSTFEDLHCGSDYTPEKQEQDHRNSELVSSLKKQEEEDKELNQLFSDTKKHIILIKSNFQSEKIYDNQNQLLNELSIESVKSNSMNFKEDEARDIRGLGLLDRARNAIVRESNISQKSDSLSNNQSQENRSFDIIEEVMSESLCHGEPKIAAGSSNHSIAPPGALSNSDHDIVCEAMSSKSEDEEQVDEKPSPTKEADKRTRGKKSTTRQTRNKQTRQHSKDAFKGKKLDKKKPRKESNK